MQTGGSLFTWALPQIWIILTKTNAKYTALIYKLVHVNDLTETFISLILILKSNNLNRNYLCSTEFI